MTPLAAYLLLFVAVGVGFIFVHLLAGKLIRPSAPQAEKQTIYECGEPTIGSAWVQFDLRFYVVALLFVIFDVEVAFFFPWAEVFGKANAVANSEEPKTAEEFREFAGKVLDLAPPDSADMPAWAARGDGAKVVGQRSRWKGAAGARESDANSLGALPAGVIRYARGMTPRAFDQMNTLDRNKLLAAKAQADELGRLIDRIRKEQRAAFVALEAAASKSKDPAAANAILADLVALPDTIAEGVRDGALGSLTRIDIGMTRLVSRTFTPAGPPPSEKLKPMLAAADLEAPETLAKKHLGEIRQAAEASVAALSAVDPKMADFWAASSPESLADFAALDDEQLKLVGSLSASALAGLDKGLIEQARSDARTLAQLAFVEILLFFGILLVGFAYLWKRGDLAWVRATAADRLAHLEAGRAAPQIVAGPETSTPAKVS